MGLLARLGFVAPEQADPSAPAAGLRRLYPRIEGWVDQDSAGVEHRLDNGALRGCRFYRTTSQTLTASIWSQLNIGEPDWWSGSVAGQLATGGAWDPTNTNNTFTVPPGEAGYYLLLLRVVFASSQTGRRIVAVTKNTTADASASNQVASGSVAPVASNPTILYVQQPLRLADSDVLRVWAWHSNSATLDVLGDGSNYGTTELTLLRQGD